MRARSFCPLSDSEVSAYKPTPLTETATVASNAARAFIAARLSPAFDFASPQSAKPRLCRQLLGLLWEYIPELLGLFLLHQLAVVLEEYCLRVASLQGGLGSVLVCGQVVGTEAVAQAVVRPFFKPECCLGLNDQGVPSVVQIGQWHFPSKLQPFNTVVADIDESSVPCFGLPPLQLNFSVRKRNVSLGHAPDFGWSNAAEEIQ